MKSMILGTIGVFASCQLAAADGAAAIAGEVMAYSNRCPTVELDFVGLERWSIVNGVDLKQIKARSGPHYDAVMRGNANAASELRSKTVSEACVEGLRMFGPGGSVIAGVLKLK